MRTSGRPANSRRPTRRRDPAPARPRGDAGDLSRDRALEDDRQEAAGRCARRHHRAADLRDDACRSPARMLALERAACDAALKAVIAGRPRSNFISYRVDNALTRDRANFADFIHYRPKLARRIEQGIVASLRDGESATDRFLSRLSRSPRTRRRARACARACAGSCRWWSLAARRDGSARCGARRVRGCRRRPRGSGL